MTDHENMVCKTLADARLRADLAEAREVITLGLAVHEIAARRYSDMTYRTRLTLNVFSGRARAWLDRGA